MSNFVNTLDQDNFKAIISGEKPVLVDFWAPWCGPCKMIAPVVEEIAESFADRLDVGKVNVDENTPLAGKYGVMGIPTLILFKGGKEVGRVVGFKPKAELESFISSNL